MSYPSRNYFPPPQPPYPPSAGGGGPTSAPPQTTPQGIPIPYANQRTVSSPYFAPANASPSAVNGAVMVPQNARRHSSNASAYQQPAMGLYSQSPTQYANGTYTPQEAPYPPSPFIGPGAVVPLQHQQAVGGGPRRRGSSNASATLHPNAALQPYQQPQYPYEGSIVQQPVYERRSSHHSDRSHRSGRSRKSYEEEVRDIEKRPSFGDTLGMMWGSVMGAFDRRK